MHSDVLNLRNQRKMELNREIEHVPKFFIFFGTLHEWKITFGQQKMNFGAIGLADRPVD